MYIYFWLSSLCVVIVVKKAMSLRKFHAISLCKLIIVYSFFDVLTSCEMKRCRFEPPALSHRSRLSDLVCILLICQWVSKTLMPKLWTLISTKVAHDELELSVTAAPTDGHVIV